MSAIPWYVWPIVGYLAGSIPFAFLIGKAHGIDLRTVGSGNVGATNCGRALGRKWGLLAFALDVLKGALPVLVAGLALGYAGRWSLEAAEALKWLSVALAAVLGHVFPVWLKFRGGKGVATSLGVLLGVYPLLTLPGLVTFGIWCACTLIWRYIGLSSVVGAIAMPVLLAIEIAVTRQPLSGAWPLLAVVGLLCVLVIGRHVGNIKRLLAGTEPKIGQKKSPEPDAEQAS